MKIKTSVTLERDLLQAIDQQAEGYGSRSGFLEMAARRLLERLEKDKMEQRDLDILNRHAIRLNIEAEDVLEYQEPL
ncbi:MAG: hypothetical protein EOM12_18205 [Verrucomicrobiae bacterium]|nr:hypothetical protein [Verrucomicrobiae bacterium]